MTHHFKKSFGQNFLQNHGVIWQIAHAIAPKRTDHLVEIGPGLGALTRELVTQCAHYSAIELDRELIPALTEQFSAFSHFTLYHADALSVDYHQLSPQPLRVIGNLPYNIAAPLLLGWMNYCNDIQDIHAMVQLEMAERIIAAPGSKDYGRLSVMLQYHCHTAGLFTVPPEAFYPAPKVTSMVIRLIPYRNNPHPVKNVLLFEALVKQAFSQRRKTIANTLKPYFTKEQLLALDLDPQQRPENLSVSDYVKLTNASGNKEKIPC